MSSPQRPTHTVLAQTVVFPLGSDAESLTQFPGMKEARRWILHTVQRSKVFYPGPIPLINLQDLARLDNIPDDLLDAELDTLARQGAYVVTQHALIETGTGVRTRLEEQDATVSRRSQARAQRWQCLLAGPCDVRDEIQ